jgi:hypothetical protein
MAELALSKGHLDYKLSVYLEQHHEHLEKLLALAEDRDTLENTLED